MNKEIERSLKDYTERQNKLQELIDKKQCFNGEVEVATLNYIMGQNDLILRLLKIPYRNIGGVMELKEAKEILRIMIKSLKEYGISHAVTDEEQRAIETVLQALDNSIPKEKIKTEIKSKMKNLWVDTCAEDSGKYTAYMSILNLLEE